MTDEQNATPPTPDPQDPSLAEKDPSDWVTGDEPATASQMSYLATLAAETRTEVPAELTKADASTLIDQLQGKSPRIDVEPG